MESELSIELDCSRCVMTRAVDPDLVVSEGVCNHCARYDALLATRIVPVAQRGQLLAKVVSDIKRAGHGKEYDCIIGVSGGVDSTFVALKVKELGLRPLAIHVDNGWNSELAVSNVEKTLTRLDLDLQTVVLDLREFYDLQRAFLFASTPDSDIPSDHAIQAVLWSFARKYKVKYIISGMNFATESISVKSWSYGHSDWRYIKNVHRRFGKVRLRTYPHFGFRTLFWTTAIRRVQIASILNYMSYDKAAAVEEMQSTLGWVAYEGKHFESIFTRWAQGFLLPRKFNIDKRRGHLSDLINSGQITRDEAIMQLAQDSYPEKLRRADEDLLKKKLRLSDNDVAAILEAAPTTFASFKNSYHFVQMLRALVNALRKRGFYPR
ncbi:N-acetyl sugar amidotransferase [Cryobacterium sp. Sr3]|uniref:N-acetyl sugar amidotransferase n=1 Tax=Cryobacterium sp. Sr3 TaxID=1259194 RepID=UPI00106A40BF|nr:N-acetyl sugar amidotransferase [Cryobacterium sp. Sr3]TFB55295.1 N-acetyl sugar amidotransferase [Cryobacterium sp. Sr3]